MKIKVDELIGYKLDYYIATAIGFIPEINNYTSDIITYKQDGSFNSLLFNPSSNWNIAGKIIEDNDISIEVVSLSEEGKYYIASTISNKSLPTWQYHESKSTSLLEAAMRCFIKSKLGDEVEDIE